MFKSKAILFVLLFSSGLAANPKIELRPTFHSCSYYIPFETKTYTECNIFYRKAGEKSWQKAYPPVYAELEKEYRGSIALLEENSKYEVKAEITPYGEHPYISTAKTETWTAQPPIAKEVPLSSFKREGKSSIEINGLKGKEKGWIRIVPDCEVDGELEDYAIRFVNCEYLLLEGATVRGGLLSGIHLTERVSDVRIINCDISGWGRLVVSQAENGYPLDKDDKSINNDGGIRVEKAKNIVIERCYIHDSRSWTNPWNGTVALGPHAGKVYKQTHPRGPCGIFMYQNGGNCVIRYNDIIGSQSNRFNDAIEGWNNGKVIGGFYQDADVYGNMLAYTQDDAIELDGGQCNVRFYHNRLEQSYCGISTAPNMKGPSYIFGNVICNMGNETGSGSAAVKNGGGYDNSIGRQFFFNNTMITPRNGIRGVGYRSKDQSTREFFQATSRNNILLSTREVTGEGKDGMGYSLSDILKADVNDFDYDMIANSTTKDGAGAMFAHESSEKHGVFAMPKFTHPDRGVYTLAEGCPALDKGIAVPNFMTSFQGKAPDLGAFQSGESSLYPQRPIALEADTYHLKMNPDTEYTVTIKVGRIDKETTFTLRKSADMSWLDVRASTHKIAPNSTLQLTLKASATDKRQVGALLVRLENGFSLPITLFVNRE